MTRRVVAGSAHLVQHGELATGLIDGGFHMLIGHAHRALHKHKMLSRLSRCFPAARELLVASVLLVNYTLT